MILVGKIVQAVPKNKNEEKRLDLLKALFERYNFTAKSFEPHKTKERDVNIELQHFSESDAIIIDLTHERPSCYYELALSELTKKPMLVFAKKGTEIFQKSPSTLINFYASDREFLDSVETFLSRLSK